MPTHYEVLGVSENASASTIRTTYLRLLQIYHPDHNNDPAAGQKTAEIIAAYSILGDEVLRAQYDQTLHPNANVETNNKEKQAPPPPPPLRQLVCEKCGKQNASLRSSLIYWVTSFLVITRRGGKTGIWCEECRAKQAALWSLVSSTIGWWGFPWGPIYTAQALYYNALGGLQDKAQNAALLRLVGFQLYEKGDLRESLAAIDASLKLESDEATSDFADSLRIREGSYVKKKFPVFKLLTAIPSVTVLVVILLWIVHLASEPTGYAARYQAPRANVSSGVVKSPSGSANRDKVNALVDALASAVKQHATVTGTRHEGNTTTTLYELDRGKYDPSEFEDLAKQIEFYLTDSSANFDGFVSSAFFNSRLMALSIEIENGIKSGQDMRPAIRNVLALGQDNRISEWLSGSSYQSQYSELCQQLLLLKAVYGSGQFNADLDTELAALKETITSTKARFEEASSNQDSTSARLSARQHDEAIKSYNKLVNRHNQLIEFHSKLDLSFNRCLDPKILMTAFHQVDLTTEVNNQVTGTDLH